MKNRPIFVTQNIMETTDFKAIIGLNIKQLREQMGLTQEKLAEFLNTSREQVGYYEIGLRSIPSEQLTKLASLFCLDEHDFYEEDSQKRNVNMAFAFRANSINTNDLYRIAQFKKVVRNYLNMKKVKLNG